MSQPEFALPTTAARQLREMLVGEIEADRLELPVLPETAAAVMEAVRDENTGARRLADIIERDQSLAAHLLRVANSAAFNRGQPIVSLPQAINRLGVASVAEIVTAVAVQGKVFRVQRFEAHLRRLWQHSAAAGVWAREIARQRRRNVEGAFLCGLLHDIGEPVLLQAVAQFEWRDKKPFDDADVFAVMEELHAQVGGVLVSRWALADWMADAIAWHHTPEAAPRHEEEAMTTCLADHLAHWALERPEDDTEALRALPILRDLNIYPEELDQLLAARECVLAITEDWA